MTKIQILLCCILFTLSWDSLSICAQDDDEEEEEEEESQIWLQDEASEKFEKKIKSSDLASIVLANGKKLDAEKGVLTIKIANNLRLVWTQVGKEGQGVLTKADLKRVNITQIDSSQSSIYVSVPQGASKKLTHIRVKQKISKSNKQAQQRDFEVYWYDTGAKKIRRDLYSFWSLSEMHTSASPSKKVSISLEIEEPPTEPLPPDRKWLEEEKSEKFVSLLKSSDLVQVQPIKGESILHEKGMLTFKVPKEFKIEAKIKGPKGSELEDKKITRKGFLQYRFVKNIDPLKRSFTLIDVKGKELHLERVDLKEEKIEYYVVNNRVKQVTREFVRFWKLKSMEVSPPPPPPKPKKSTKKNQGNQGNAQKKETEEEKEQAELERRLKKTHFDKIILSNNEEIQAESEDTSIFIDSDFQITGLTPQGKEKKLSATSTRNLKAIRAIKESDKTLILVSENGTETPLTQVEITEPYLEILNKETDTFSSEMLLFWRAKEIFIQSSEDAPNQEEKKKTTDPEND